jgi:hypothetical protein
MPLITAKDFPQLFTQHDNSGLVRGISQAFGYMREDMLRKQAAEAAKMQEFEAGKARSFAFLAGKPMQEQDRILMRMAQDAARQGLPTDDYMAALDILTQDERDLFFAQKAAEAGIKRDTTALGKGSKLVDSQTGAEIAANLPTDENGDIEWGKINYGDYTPESIAEFIEAGGDRENIGLLKRYAAPQVVMIGGVPHKVTRSDTSGELVAEAIPLSDLETEKTGASELAAAKAGAAESAKLSAQAGSGGVSSADVAADVTEAEAQVKNTWAPKIAEAVKLSQVEAPNRGEVLNELGQMRAALPGLTGAVNELKELSKVATYTTAGRLFDFAVKESGFGATEGATARAKFIAIVNNQVLPLLKPTFGGSFSVQEGESLKATMGDPDATPEEKAAQLEAFIQQKIRDVETKSKQVGDAPEVVNWSDL